MLQNLLFSANDLIAHRLSKVVAVDNIFVLDKGRIVQTGTHEELTRQNGLYRRMFAGKVLV